MIIEQSVMAEHLRKLKGIAAKNRSGSIYRGILVEGASIMATNGAFSVRLPIGVENDDTFIIPQDASDLILNLPAGQITLEVEKNALRIACGSVKAKFITLDTEQYLKPAHSSDAVPQILKWQDVKEKLSSILFACGSGKEKPVMAGVHFFTNDGWLNMLACDGYRMAWERVKFDGDVDCVIGKDVIQSLISICTGDDLELRVSDAVAGFKTEEFELNARLIDGKYPEVHKMQPEYANTAMVLKSSLLSTIRRAQPLCDIIVIDGTVRDGSFTISCRSETLQYSEEVELETSLREGLKISMSSSFLLDAISAPKGEDEIKIGFAEGQGANEKAVTITAGTFLGLILPIKMR